MIDYTPIYDTLRNTRLKGWLDTLPALVDASFAAHGKLPEWSDAIAQLPQLTPSLIELKARVQVGVEGDVDSAEVTQLETQLRRLHPWRKGPFSLYGLDIDTEWRSDWKWDRFIDHIRPMAGKRILDVGCGNGYFMWRMLGHGARHVVGLDPFIIYVMQFHAVQALLAGHLDGPPLAEQLALLPLGIEALPPKLQAFDTTFSMGVLYHRRSPFDHLFELRDTLRHGGELVLETIVIDGKLGDVLVPERRYAQMRNVWFLPSTLTLESWLRKAKFRNIRLVDVTPTTLQEQRTTDWMTFHSLSDYLDPEDPCLTMEGHPAPLRATFIAEAP